MEEDIMSNDELYKKFGVTDENLNGWAAEYESRSWDDMSFGEIIQGRLRISSEELKPITVKIPASRIVAIQRITQKNGLSRSEFLRQAIDNEIIDMS